MKKIALFMVLMLGLSLAFAQAPTEVKGLKLKFLLVDVAYEIYQVNVDSINVFTRANYERTGCGDHYHWMKQVYASFSEKQKKDMKIVMTTIHPWMILNNAAQFPDSAKLDDLLYMIAGSSPKAAYQKAAKRFYPQFYSLYLKTYLEQHESRFQSLADSMNDKISRDSFNIFDFMEKASGLTFENRMKSEFYYVFRPIGAMGFQTPSAKVSLIQSTVKRYSSLFFTPFHEFSHELFRHFTNDTAFISVAETMKQDTSMVLGWKALGRDSYDWNGWCEENLVEGFSNFLMYKLSAYRTNRGIYVYDLAFGNYLIDHNFNPETRTLEDVALEFYRERRK